MKLATMHKIVAKFHETKPVTLIFTFEHTKIEVVLYILHDFAAP